MPVNSVLTVKPIAVLVAFAMIAVLDCGVGSAQNVVDMVPFVFEVVGFVGDVKFSDLHALLNFKS